MITLRKLQWSNCFSYGPDNEIDLTDSTLTQILGTNGMGKSSIPLIIEEALFNKNSKGIKKADIPNRYINKGYSIRLEFTKGEDTYAVSVDRKSSIKVKLEKNGEDISSHTATNTYKTLQEVIELDFKTFSQLVYQNTNTSLQFLTATDTARKKFLIDLLQLDVYVELFELFKSLSKDAGLKVTRVESSIQTIEKWLEDNKLSDTTVLPLLEVSIQTEDTEKEIASLTEEIKNISDKNKKISTNNTYKKLLKEADQKKASMGEKVQKISYDSEQGEVGGLKQVIAGAQRTITKLKDLGDKCPTCEQEVDEAKLNEMIAEEESKKYSAQEKLEVLQKRIQEIQTQNKIAEKQEEIENDWKELYRSVDQTLPSEPIDKEVLDSRLRNLRDKLSTARSEIQRIQEENNERIKKNTRLQVVQEQTEEFLQQLKEHEKTLKEQKELSSDLEILKKSFSTNGLIAYKIENLVKELEELVNHYLGEFSDGRFTLEFVVSNDKLNVEITDNGSIVNILALSSGELARVNTATLLAIRRLMSSISKSRINVLFLDEVINVLDELGREKLVEVLLEEELNTYIVSHGWSHPLLNKIEVVKCENISHLEH